MATIRLHDAGRKYAASLIASGSVDASAPWSFSAEDGSEILGKENDWAAYGQVHLGVRTGIDRKTKKAWAYPFSRGGQLYRSALIAARSRAAQQNHRAVFEAAGQLLAELDGEKASRAADNIAAIGDTFAAVELDPTDWDNLSERWVQILPYGEHTLLDERFLRVTDRSLQIIPERFRKRANALVVDYEHGTFNPMIPMGGLAAGWIWEIHGLGPGYDFSKLEDVGDLPERYQQWGPGVYALVSWTEAARARIQAREYMYLSPVLRLNDDSEPVELKGAGIVNDPAIDGMMPLAASRQCGSLGLSQAVRDASPTGAAAEVDSGSNAPKQQTGGCAMEWQTLAASLGIVAKDEAEFEVRLKALKAGADEASSSFAALKTEHEALKAEQATKDAEALVDPAIADGRFAKDDRDLWVELACDDRARFDRLLASSKAGVYSAEPKTPPQGRDMAAAHNRTAKSEGTIQLFLNDPSDKRLNVNSDRLKEAEEHLTKMRAQHGGNLARALRGRVIE